MFIKTTVGRDFSYFPVTDCVFVSELKEKAYLKFRVVNAPLDECCLTMVNGDGISGKMRIQDLLQGNRGQDLCLILEVPQSPGILAEA